jgi:spermidine synthase
MCNNTRPLFGRWLNMRATLSPLPSVLMLGIVSQVAQVVLLRELLMVFHGNELSIGIILAAWLAWVGIGSALGALIAERRARVLPALTLNAMALLPLLLLTVLAIRGLRGRFDVLPGAYLSLGDITLSSFTVLAPVCVLVGMQFVLLAKSWRQEDRAQDTRGAGKAYIFEAVGSIVGGLAFTFVMVHHLNSLQSVVLAGMLMVAAALWAGRRAHDLGAPLRWAAPALVLTAAASLPFLGVLDSWAHGVHWRQLAPEHALVETRQSRFGTIAVARRDDQYSFFRSGHLVFSSAGPATASPHLEEQEAAVLAHLALVQHPHPRRVLLIGGGLRGTLPEIARHPLDRIDYVELDEALTSAAHGRVAQGTLDALADPRVRLVHLDGRLFIKSAGDRYDVVIIDVPDPATAVLNRFYTREFFGELGARLETGGVLVLGAVSTPGLRGSAVANRNATLQHTLASVFPDVLPVGDRFLYFLASGAAGAISADPAELQRRYLARGVQSPAFSAAHFQLLFEESRLRRVNWILRNHGRSPAAHLEAPPPPPLRPPPLAEQRALEAALPPVAERFFINSDFRPIGYFYSLMFWGDLTRAGSAEALGRLLHIQGWWILPAAGLLLAIGLALRLVRRATGGRPDRAYAVGLAVFTTGLSTMALQIALLFSFQAIYGFVYEMVGLVVAIFMAGLASGTAATQHTVRDKADTSTLAAVQVAIAVAAGLIALALPRAAALESPAAVFALFSALTFAAGFLNGLDFPLATESFRALNRRAERSAGLVYGIELAGACVGAAIASAIVAPIIGIVACCLMAAAANLAAATVLLISRGTDGRANLAR